MTGILGEGGGGGRRNQFIQLVKVLYCKLPTIDKQLPTFPHNVLGLNCRPQRWVASVLPMHKYNKFILLFEYEEYEDCFR